ncbi:class I SAM-dependent methyltransferase [Erythrobacter dokdonensis]|uniref:class I SAM-dependent methyltransferase n=1 Tax=Erythrobacter dokdonensis TaxID=328225 RepID=UPI00083B5DE1|nr:class I SAM-dependent methyltransferase [Erythrobacter dokdonensis]
MNSIQHGNIPLDRQSAGQVDPLLGALGDDGWFPSPAHIIRRAALLDTVGSWQPATLLEMGCGAGRLLADWDRLGFRGQAVEPDAQSRAMARRCAAHFAPNFEVVERATLCNVDYIVSTEVLEHVDDPLQTIREWVEHLKDGGYFLATVPAFQAKWGASDEWAGHVQRFEPEEFRALLVQAGLVVVSVEVYGGLLGDLIRIAGNEASRRKMAVRANQPSRENATFASGRDRSIENRLAPILKSLPGRALMHTAIAAQKWLPGGHGLIAVARKLRDE